LEEKRSKRNRSISLTSDIACKIWCVTRICVRLESLGLDFSFHTANLVAESEPNTPTTLFLNTLSNIPKDGDYDGRSNFVEGRTFPELPKGMVNGGSTMSSPHIPHS
jgi:hypothetical protein